MNLFTKFGCKSSITELRPHRAQFLRTAPIQRTVIKNKPTQTGRATGNIFGTGNNLNIYPEFTGMECMKRNNSRICYQRGSHLMGNAGKRFQIGNLELRIRDNFKKNRTSIFIYPLTDFVRICKVAKTHFDSKCR